VILSAGRDDRAIQIHDRRIGLRTRLRAIVGVQGLIEPPQIRQGIPEMRPVQPDARRELDPFAKHAHGILVAFERRIREALDLERAAVSKRSQCWRSPALPRTLPNG